MKPDFIYVDAGVKEPVYKQLIFSIQKAISDGYLSIGHALPSVNEIVSQFSMSRDSVFKAYNHLRAQGIVEAIPGKGYYVTSTNLDQPLKIFLLFDEFTAYKEILYNSFKDAIGSKGEVDIFFHHQNSKLFLALLSENIKDYNTFVVIPMVNEAAQKAVEILPAKRTFILDIGLEIYGNKYAFVGQNFANDIYIVLESGIELLKKYNKIVLVFPEKLFLTQIKEGFERFGKNQEKLVEIVYSPTPILPAKGTAYIFINDNDMVNVIQAAQKEGLEIGREIGIISYNDTPLKSVVAEGITTLSTDFHIMGTTMADMILNKKKGIVENPCKLIIRNSL